MEYHTKWMYSLSLTLSQGSNGVYVWESLATVNLYSLVGLFSRHESCDVRGMRGGDDIALSLSSFPLRRAILRQSAKRLVKIKTVQSSSS